MLVRAWQTAFVCLIAFTSLTTAQEKKPEVKKAEGKAPACVSACQMRVLQYGDIEELRAAHGSAGAIFPFPDPSITQPNTTFTPHRDSVPADDASAQIMNPEEV